MSEWKKVKLGDVSLCIQPGPFGTQLHNSDYTDKGVPVIMPKDMIDGRVLHDKLEHVSEDTANRISRHKVDAGDIMVARKGDVRKCIYIRESEEGWITGSDCLKMQLNQKICNSKFIYFQLRSPYIGAWLQQVSKGATMPSLNTSLLSNIEIVLPPISTQNNVAEILSRYDSLIENYQKQIKLLEEAAQRLYKEWFVDLRFPGYENTKIVDGVPEGWEKKKLEDIFSYVRGRSYTSKELSDSGTILVNLKNIQAFGGYKRDAEKRYLGDYKQEQSLEVGDLIMGVTDMTQERRLVGHVALIPDFDEPATFSMDLIKILPFELSKSFLYCAMRFGGISKQISPLANGVNVLHLKPEAMMGIEMVVPSKELVNHFDDYIKNNFNTILYLQNQIRYLTEARDRLLPKLMSGEITV